ncbi:MAG: nucleotidyltransferase family protein [Candidatus Omnitrophica bacterium]|nr:nucleotidyltransferase family protein [Candidatus Omnitrophota bacterium]MDD5430400.1 nucleotidyltransferase family protein [Candidatus Omnitrophota bacterium]
MNQNFKNIDVVIICGGQGKRLKQVINDRPKVLAQINGRPFIDILIDRLLKYGFKRFILCVGYQKEKIREHFREKSKYFEVLFSQEDTPLGTGGALKRAQPLIKSDAFLAMNGDSFCPVDFNNFFSFHTEKKSFLTLLLAKVSSSKDYGTVELGSSFRIKDFKEKSGSDKEAFINAGVYLMEKSVFGKMPKKEAFSLEYDFFPAMVCEKIYGYITDGEFVDIGTPLRYEKAQAVINGR